MKRGWNWWASVLVPGVLGGVLGRSYLEAGVIAVGLMVAVVPGGEVSGGSAMRLVKVMLFSMVAGVVLGALEAGYLVGFAVGAAIGFWWKWRS